MRWIHFTAGGRTAYGIVEGDTIAERFLLRWRGEVEHIQSGAVYEVSSLAEVFSLIGQAVAPGREHPVESEGDMLVCTFP